MDTNADVCAVNTTLAVSGAVMIHPMLGAAHDLGYQDGVVKLNLELDNVCNWSKLYVADMQ